MSTPARSATCPAVALAPPPPATVDVLGDPLACTDYDATVDWIEAMVAARRRGYVCVAATHTVMAAREDGRLRDAVLGSSMTVPDGQPLVWAMNALGARLHARVYGPTLMQRAMERSVQTGTRHFLYGGGSNTAPASLAQKHSPRPPRASRRWPRTCSGATPASSLSAATRRPSAR